MNNNRGLAGMARSPELYNSISFRKGLISPREKLNEALTGRGIIIQLVAIGGLYPFRVRSGETSAKRLRGSKLKAGLTLYTRGVGAYGNLKRCWRGRIQVRLIYIV